VPYVYPEAATLQRKPKVGDGDCVALVREYTRLKTRPARSWKQGAPVLNNKAIKPGTAIATFVKGRYPGRPQGNHAAFYLRPGPDGFWVIDQWKRKKRIESRYIKSEGVRADGSYPDASDNADAFSVIE
jgi:hypothetical protein